MKTLVFATYNDNKLIEVQILLETGKYKLQSLGDLNITEDIPETKDTICENAIQKAEYLYGKYKMDCFADDTGLCIDALDGKPGVFSARYAGPKKDSLDNMKKVLDEMEGAKNRSAQFKTVIALFIDGNRYIFKGICQGTITNKPIGKDGFGYDPIFIPKGYSNTFAEMTIEEKNRISHRAKAVEQLVAFLKSY